MASDLRPCCDLKDPSASLHPRPRCSWAGHDSRRAVAEFTKPDLTLVQGTCLVRMVASAARACVACLLCLLKTNTACLWPNEAVLWMISVPLGLRGCGTPANGRPNRVEHLLECFLRNSDNAAGPHGLQLPIGDAASDCVVADADATSGLRDAQPGGRHASALTRVENDEYPGALSEHRVSFVGGHIRGG